MDIRLGIHHADLHPVVEDLHRHRVGELHLLTSKFSTGFLLDGRHPDICPGAPPVQGDHAAQNVVRSSHAANNAEYRTHLRMADKQEDTAQSIAKMISEMRTFREEILTQVKKSEESMTEDMKQEIAKGSQKGGHRG